MRKAMILLAVAFVSVFATSTSQAGDSNFWLTKPVDWNTTVNQVQLDMNASLRDPIKEFKANITATLSDDADGSIDKIIPVRFPLNSDFEKNDPDKWSFVTPKETSAKRYTCEFYARVADFSQTTKFMYPTWGTILWEHFILFTKFPTKGKLRIEFTNVQATSANGAVYLPETSFFCEIVFTQSANPVVELKIDTVGNWFDKTNNQIKLAAMFKGPSLKKLSTNILMPKGSKIISGANNLTLVYNGVKDGQDSYLLQLYDVAGSNAWKNLGYIQIELPSTGRSGDYFSFEDITAFDYNGASLSTNSPYTVYIKYPIFSGIHDEAMTKFKVWPNPVQQVLNLEVDDTMGEITVLNLYGGLVMSLPASNRLDVSTLASGTYTIIVKNGNKNSYQSFIKE